MRANDGVEFRDGRYIITSNGNVVVLSAWQELC